MNAPLQITFRNMEPSPMVEQWVREEAEKLETFYSSIMGLRVAVEIPHRHRVKGNTYHVRIDLTVPQGELVINRQPNPRNQARRTGQGTVTKRLEMATPHKNLRLAIDDAFRIAGRRLQDFARRQSGNVKAHESSPRAQVTRILPGEGYGFLTTADGREIYFHKQSVLNGGFARLRVGSPVTFVEEQGEKGAQASTVRLVGKNAPAHRVAAAAAASAEER